MTLDAAAVVIGFALVVLWLIALTMGQARTRARVGEPVYRRLPDGRIRFEWQVGTTYPAACRASKTSCGPP